MQHTARFLGLSLIPAPLVLITLANSHAISQKFSMENLSTSREDDIKPKANTNKKRRRRRKPRLTGLSKERLTANARERSRMQSISNALLHLRYHLPASVVPKDKKLSKIQTLRLAIGYINSLWQVVQGDVAGNDLVHSDTNDIPINNMISDESLTASPCSESSSMSSSIVHSECDYCDDIS